MEKAFEAQMSASTTEVPRSIRRNDSSGIGPGAIPDRSDVNVGGSRTNRDVQRCGRHLVNSLTRGLKSGDENNYVENLV